MLRQPKYPKGVGVSQDMRETLQKFNKPPRVDHSLQLSPHGPPELGYPKITSPSNLDSLKNSSSVRNKEYLKMQHGRDRSLDVVKMGQPPALPPFAYKNPGPVMKKKEISPSLSNYERDQAQ